MPEVTLTVEEAVERDEGRGIARLPGEVMRRLDLTSGDPVKLVGDEVDVRTVDPGEDGCRWRRRSSSPPRR